MPRDLHLKKGCWEGQVSKLREVCLAVAVRKQLIKTWVSCVQPDTCSKQQTQNSGFECLSVLLSKHIFFALRGLHEKGGAGREMLPIWERDDKQ